MNIQIKVDPNHPETTKAIIRLLVGLGYPDKSGADVEHATWLYLRGERIDGWNQVIDRIYSYKTINITNQHTVSFDGGDPVEISAESFANLKQLLTG